MVTWVAASAVGCVAVYRVRDMACRPWVPHDKPSGQEVGGLAWAVRKTRLTGDWDEVVRVRRIAVDGAAAVDGWQRHEHFVWPRCSCV